MGRKRKAPDIGMLYYQSRDEQREQNARIARMINSYWRERGVEANACVVRRVIDIDFAWQDGVKVPLERPHRVESHEIVSDLRFRAGMKTSLMRGRKCKALAA